MTIEFIKHDREVTSEQLQKYGKYATHDMLAPIILLYPAGTIPDKNGTQVKIDEAFMQSTMKATNAAIKKRFNNPLAKAKSFFINDVNKYEVIPIIKNHKTDDVDNTSGYTQGLAYIKELENIKCLMINAIIKDPETKRKIDGDIFRHTSLGTRADGSIKEISIVSNEALPHGGFVMSEPDLQNTIKTSDNEQLNISKKQLLLSEQINELKLQEHNINTITIPNHIVLSNMIKKGKIEPYKYDELINQNPQIVELMEKSLPSNNLGIMLGTIKQPEKIDISDKLINETINKYNAKHNPEKLKKPTVEQSKHIEGVKQNMYSFEEIRKNELKHILELAEYSPEIMVKYIAHELGEKVQVNMCNDKYLSEYINKANQLKSKIINLEIQLGEF